MTFDPQHSHSDRPPQHRSSAPVMVISACATIGAAWVWRSVEAAEMAGAPTAFKNSPGYLVTVLDMSEETTRVLAEWAGDSALHDALAEEQRQALEAEGWPGDWPDDDVPF